MKNKLGYPQKLLLRLYKSCKGRSKRHLAMNNPNDSFHSDEELINFMLENTSITDDDANSSRCYHKTADAILNLCRNMCPGEWCTRSHCRNHDGGEAYYCTKTRPAVCREYKEYIRKKAIRDERKMTDDKNMQK